MKSQPRLEKTTSFPELWRAAASFGVALCLFGMAALFYYSGSPLFTVLALLPAILGVLIFCAGIHAIFASGTPLTTISLNEEPLVRGQTVSVMIRQAGPARFESLRASLVCEKTVGRGKTRNVTYPCLQNFFDSGRFEITLVNAQEFSASVTIRSDAEASCEEVGLTISWRIEIWGKVIGRADFMRPFDVEVV